MPQEAVAFTFPTEESAFGLLETLIERGLEEDAILEGQRDAKVGAIVDELQGARYSLQNFEDKVQFVSRITMDLNIDVPFIIADTVDEYLVLLRDMGYNVKDDDGETIGMYFLQMM